MTDCNLVWENAIEEIKLSVSPAVFQTLFGQTYLKKVTKNCAIVGCNSSYIADLIEKRYKSILKQALERQLKKTLVIKIKVVRQKTKQLAEAGPLFEEKSAEKTVKPENRYNPKTGLHPQFTFETFVVGNSNNFAFAAAQGIVNNPGTVYNPFFVYGGVGVGKTHLVQAIGYELSLKTDLKIIYSSAETFTNELISALREKTTSRFKQKYRHPDVLIIDDIQFISGKEFIQEEFFHTFNSLHLSGKQVILTSDRKPEELGQIEERLISRFMGGLTVDIQLPDYEMRVAILKQKAEEKEIEIPEDAISFIAETIQSNTRQLEGTLLQISTKAKSEGKLIDLENVRSFFGIKKQREQKKVSYRKILSAVGKTFKVKTNELCGKTRKKQIALARHVAAYLLRKELDIPLKQIGTILGGRDHTTIMHAQDKIDRAFSTNQQIRHQIIKIQKQIYQH